MKGVTVAEWLLGLSILASLAAVWLMRAGSPAVWLVLLFVAYLLALAAWYAERTAHEGTLEAAKAAARSRPRSTIATSAMVSRSALGASPLGPALVARERNLAADRVVQMAKKHVHLDPDRYDEAGNLIIGARLHVIPADE